MLTLVTISLLAASYGVLGSPLLPPKHEHPTNMAPSRPASCSRVCPLVNGRGNVLKLLHADYRIIDGIKATVCEYTEDMRCLYDEDVSVSCHHACFHLHLPPVLGALATFIADFVPHTCIYLLG